MRPEIVVPGGGGMLGHKIFALSIGVERR